MPRGKIEVTRLTILTDTGVTDLVDRAQYEEALRNALTWRRRYDDLEVAIDELFLWQPGRRGWAAAFHLFKLRRRAIESGQRLDFDTAESGQQQPHPSPEDAD